MTTIPYQGGMKLGFGYNQLAGTHLTTPAVQGTVSAIAQAIGEGVLSSFLRITDLDTLHQELGVTVDAGGSYYGVSADVKVNYANECNVSQFATHVMVRVTVQDAFENFDAPVLTDDARNLLTNTGGIQSTRFRERFGDAFIDGLQKGGEYFATWEIVSVDETVREAIATKVEAGFNDLVAAAHLDVDVQTAKASSSSHVEVHVHVMQKGAIDPTDQTMQEILNKAHNFPPSVAGDNAAPFAVSIADYKTLNLPNDAFNFIDIQNQKDVLEEHARKRFDFLTLRNSISYIRLHPEDFEDVDDTLLAKQLRDVTDAINKMEEEASACLRNPGACQFTPFDVSDFPLPRVKRGSPLPTTVMVPDFSEASTEDVVKRLAANNHLKYELTYDNQLSPIEEREGLFNFKIVDQTPRGGSPVSVETTVRLIAHKVSAGRQHVDTTGGVHVHPPG